MNNEYKIPGYQRSSDFIVSTIMTFGVMVMLFMVAVYTARASSVEPIDVSYKLQSTNATVKADSTKVYQVVEEMPKIVGGLPAVYKNIEYPKTAVRAGVQGRVFLKFVVDEEGNVRDPQVLKDIGAGCGNAAIEAIKQVKFTPGRHNGKVVKVQYSLPVKFQLKD